MPAAGRLRDRRREGDDGGSWRHGGSSTRSGRSGAGAERTSLSCWRRATAARSRWPWSSASRTLAFPAISCGIYGYPPELAAADRGRRRSRPRARARSVRALQRARLRGVRPRFGRSDRRREVSSRTPPSPATAAAPPAIWSVPAPPTSAVSASAQRESDQLGAVPQPVVRREGLAVPRRLDALMDQRAKERVLDAVRHAADQRSRRRGTAGPSRTARRTSQSALRSEAAISANTATAATGTRGASVAERRGSAPSAQPVSTTPSASAPRPRSSLSVDEVGRDRGRHEDERHRAAPIAIPSCPARRSMRRHRRRGRAGSRARCSTAAEARSLSWTSAISEKRRGVGQQSRASSRHPRPGRHRSAGRPEADRARATRPARSPRRATAVPASSGTRANSAAWPIAAPAPSSAVSASTSRDRAAAEGQRGDDDALRERRGDRDRPRLEPVDEQADVSGEHGDRGPERDQEHRDAEAVPHLVARSASARTATQSPIAETAIAAATMRRSRGCSPSTE